MSAPLDGYQRVGALSQVRGDVWRMGTKLTCPHCAYRFDAIGGDPTVGSGRPENGDYAMCMACGQPLRFVTGALGFLVRACTEEEAAEFHADNADAVAALRVLHEHRPPREWARRPGDR